MSDYTVFTGYERLNRNGWKRLKEHPMPGEGPVLEVYQLNGIIYARRDEGWYYAADDGWNGVLDMPNTQMIELIEKYYQKPYRSRTQYRTMLKVIGCPEGITSITASNQYCERKLEELKHDKTK